MCLKCNNNLCNGSHCKVLPKGLRGPRGPQGPQGKQGIAGPRGTSSSNSILFADMGIQLTLDGVYGQPYTGTPTYISAGFVEKINSLSLTVIEAANYIINVEFTLDAGQQIPQKWIGYELRLNNAVIPYTTRSVRIEGGTPANYINSFCLNANILSALPGDEISLWVANINDVPPDSDYRILILSGSITARSY